MPNDNQLHKAAHLGELEECRKWVENPDDDCDPIDVNCPGAAGRRPLHRAAGAGRLNVCEYLIFKGAPINQQDNSGRTALHWAAIAGHKEVIAYLLKNDADLMTVTSTESTPLHMACEAMKEDSVKEILSYLATNPELRKTVCTKQNSDGKTAFDIAVASKNDAIITALKVGGDENASAACIIS